MPSSEQGSIRDIKPIAVRVPPDVRAVLEVARVAYGLRSLQELLAPVVEKFAKDLADKPQIQAMIRSRAELIAETGAGGSSERRHV